MIALALLIVGAVAVAAGLAPLRPALLAVGILAFCGAWFAHLVEAEHDYFHHTSAHASAAPAAGDARPGPGPETRGRCPATDRDDVPAGVAVAGQP